MKTTPTDLDREAARLFRIEVRMRAFTEFARGTVINADPMDDGTICVTLVGEGTYEALGRPVAIDADDPATAGQMLAQVEAMRPGQAVSIVDRLRSLPGEDERRFAVLVEHDGAQTVATGPTRGAALVAAMKALKGAT